MEKIKQYLKYVVIAILIIGIFAGIRYLSLEFAGVRWTLLFLISSGLGKLFEQIGSALVSYIFEIPINYVVAGFLFGYGTINNMICAHWIGTLITVVVLLILCLYVDFRKMKDEK